MANTRKTVDEMEFPYPHNEGLNVLCVCVLIFKKKKKNHGILYLVTLHSTIMQLWNSSL